VVQVISVVIRLIQRIFFPLGLDRAESGVGFEPIGKFPNARHRIERYKLLLSIAYN
jgi:hypothetical protein